MVSALTPIMNNNETGSLHGVQKLTGAGFQGSNM